MALTGRFVALTLVGVLLAIASARAAALYAAGLAALGLLDLALAGRVAGLGLLRQASSPVRLGEAGETRLRVANGGRRTVRALVRDAWVPSAGARPRQQ